MPVTLFHGSQGATAQAVILGPARSGKTHRALAEYRRALRELPLGACLWLSPTSRSAQAVRLRLLDGESGGFFRPNVMTFERFVASIVTQAAEEIRPISLFAKRVLLRRIIDQLHAHGELPIFGEISQTSGFVEMLSSFISEIKRLEIWPEQLIAACRARKIREKDLEIHKLYERYQQELNACGLYDAQGQFWTARTLIRDNKRAPFDRLQLIVADGFTDFTSTQHEILRDLAVKKTAPGIDDGSPRLIITLTGEENSARGDLFAKPSTTLAKLSQDFGEALRVEVISRRTTKNWRGMDHLESNLFGPPEQSLQAPAARIQLLEAAGEVAEIEEVARTIKQLLTRGDSHFVGTPVKPQDILVTFRSVDEHAVLIRETFDRYGIPHAMESGPRVAESGFFRALLHMLALVAEDWPHRRLLAILTSNYFCPAGMEANDPIAALKLVRALQVPFGRRELLKSATGYLGWLERRDARRTGGLADSSGLETTVKTPTKQPPAERTGWDELGSNDVASCRKAVEVLQALDAVTSKLPKSASAAEWMQAIAGLVEQLGLETAFANDAESQLNRWDAQAWQMLVDSFTSLDRGLSSADGRDTERNDNQRQMDLAGFRRLLTDFGRMTRLSESHDEIGRVRVLSAKSVRSLDAAYVFFAGLTERAFPAIERSDALLNEAENRQLREAGLPLANKDQHYSAELLLFYEVITRATRGLWLSFPAFDEWAEPLLPSPFVLEIQRAFGDGNLKLTRPESLSPVPEDPPCCEDEFRLLAVDSALARKPKHLVAWAADGEKSRANNLLTGLEVVANRGQKRSFGPWEGMLKGPQALENCGREFGDQRTWSATDLESYARCPYHFFLDRVLRVKEVVDLRLEIDYLSRGRLVHDVLYRLQRSINREHGGPTSPAEISPEEYDRLAEVNIQQVLDENPTADGLRGALREIDRRLMVSWLEDYREQHKSYDAQRKGLTAPLRPAHFEVAFGLPDADGDSLSTTKPFPLDHNGEMLRLRGRIDRIDVGRHGEQDIFSVIDFKSGRRAPGFRERQDLRSRRLQLELYTLAAQQLLLRGQDAIPWVSAFWFLAVDGANNWRRFSEVDKQTGQLMPSSEWEQRRPLLLDQVFGMVRAMQRGQFPVASADDGCTSYCEFATVCRVGHIRSLQKEWAPPAK
ncbi:MAG: exodeoxyribonuclease V subunit gamma [Pirellulales bacterium]|nr:exodeoxyribonuclease V subunit gamma [Pirellulales bacterium]